MEHEDEIDGEVHQVVTEVESGNERLQINIDHNEHRRAVETAAEGEEGDIEVDRFFLRVCRIIDSVLRLGSSPTTEINSELHGSLEQPGTGEGSIDSVASLSPSHTADTLVPTGSVSTAGASLEFLEMLPVVKTTDLPEEFRKCTICNESLGDGEIPKFLYVSLADTCLESGACQNGPPTTLVRCAERLSSPLLLPVLSHRMERRPCPVVENSRMRPVLNGKR